MTALRLSAVALLALALTGCFVSSAPLIPPDKAEHPFEGRTAYTLSNSKDGGKTWSEENRGAVARAGDGYRLDGEDDSAFTLRRAFNDYYIAQQADDGEYYYDLLRVEGDHVYVYRFTCGDEDQRHVNSGLIDALGGQGDDVRCEVSDFGKLAEVFRARLDAGALPKSLYVIK